MSQPPAPSGGPLGRPGPYGPGPYPGSYPQPGSYPPPGPFPPQGAPGPYGPGVPPYGPPPPPKRNLLPWFIVGGAVLLSGLGILLVVLLTGPDDDTSTAAGDQVTASATSEPAPDDASADAGSLPGGASAVDTEEADSGAPGETAYAGSEEVALDFMNALLNRENQAAYDLSCDALQGAGVAFGAAIGGTAADGLAQAFRDTVANGEFMTDGTFDGIAYEPAADVDRATFTAVLESGSSVVIHVDVESDLTVCNWY
ncbi:hypothetical protein [Blastococcus sp. CT_GayMR16]|uniref:hypothetical protein n=1 Tax=Blastococcus sp. CT_GayMR16 TaxID=2559607 RepID=UPI00107438A6|nr:hypothetical protein [Blastococcus sp. CT_GayMR16]TFV91233.1 hypothetical protein E4P38_01115 [Blastococcus sp. CT_GayMR16]